MTILLGLSASSRMWKVQMSCPMYWMMLPRARPRYNISACATMHQFVLKRNSLTVYTTMYSLVLNRTSLYFNMPCPGHRHMLSLFAGIGFAVFAYHMFPRVCALGVVPHGPAWFFQGGIFFPHGPAWKGVPFCKFWDSVPR